tara:strand:- start:15926 stop:16789 length:864 start_codon:yes stop_codon:yes gene_type:complete
MGNNIIITEKQLNKIEFMIEEEVPKDQSVRAYSFDWDDNIIKMPTTIKMLKKTPSGWEKVEVGTHDFSSIRNSTHYKLDEGAFDDFIDDDSFISDLTTALTNKAFAPSFEKFKEALIYANPLSIITARGHTPEALRKGIDLVISYSFNEEELAQMMDNIQERFPETKGQDPTTILKTYLDTHDFHPVTSEFFIEKFGLEGGSAANPEESKKIALRDYVTKVVNQVEKMVNTDYNKLSVGFSDDDLGNINAIIPFIKEVLQVEFPEVAFVVYDTSEGGMNKIILKQTD